MKDCSASGITLLRNLFMGMALLSMFPGFSQNDSLIQDYSYYERKFKLNALVVGRYAASLNENIDHSGQHFIGGNEDLVSNSFEMQYVRLSTNFFINDKISTSILVNLAEFKNDNVNGKVLENAYVSYRHNSHLNIIMGQFRPFFGLEDLYPFQLDNSYAWSNQYFLFGRNGWQSFQVGAAVFGSLKSNKIPVSYYLTAYNGNNRNAMGDNDSSKNITFRLEYFPVPVLKIGVNAGSARFKRQPATAFGIDTQFRRALGDRFDIDVNAEYKNGTNFEAFRNAEVSMPNLDNYRMEGFYSLFKLRYRLMEPRFRALEFSFRQEYLDSNTLVRFNERRTFVPMLSLVLAGDYDAKLSLVGVINDYKSNLPGTTQYDSKKLLIQFQVAY